jgi:hypothetical protein
MVSKIRENRLLSNVKKQQKQLDTLKGISPPARRGEQDVDVENGDKRQVY